MMPGNTGADVQARVKADHVARGILEADTRRREGGLSRGVVLLVESKDHLVTDVGGLEQGEGERQI